MHKVLIVSDAQIPYEDPQVVEAVVAFAKVWQPNEVIYNGDMLDFPQLTTKFERRRARENTLSQDISHFAAIDSMFHEAAPKAKRILLPGNHEARIEKLVLENADGLEDLLNHELGLPHLLRGFERGFEVRGNYLAGTAYYERGGLVITHGDATNLELLARDYGSCVVGHGHREQVFSYSSRAGDRRVPHKVVMTGALCNVSGPHVPPSTRKTEIKSWTQGFACAWFDDNGYTVVPVTLVDGSFIGPDGRRYG